MGFLLKYILTHKSGRRSYRRPFPAELRQFLPGEKREHKVSLGLEGSPGFFSRYEDARKEFERLVATARRRLEGAYDTLDGPQIAYLAEVFRVERLEEDEEARWSPDERDLFNNVAADLQSRGLSSAINWRGDESRRWADKARETLEFMLPVYKDFRAIGDLKGIVKFWRDEALELIDTQGLIVDLSAEEPVQRLCRALNDAAIGAAQDKLRRLGGDDVPTPLMPDLARPIVPQRSSNHRLPMLETFDAYAMAQGLTPGVRVEWRRYVSILIEFVGHDDAAQLTADKLRAWRDHLLNEPTRNGSPRKAVTVRDKYITPVRAMLAWAVEEQKLSVNVAADVTVRVPKEAKLRDLSFTDSEARAILTATLQPSNGRMSPSYVRALRWIPWLCAYTGARVNECTQLRGKDVQEIEGIWTVRITPEAGTVKGKEARVVPIHAHLIEQGFLAMARDNGPGPLFFDPTLQKVQADSNRHFKKVGERLAGWVRNEVGITDPALQPNHAWRHTFKSLSYDVGIEERVVDAIQAHAPKTTGRSYGRPSLKALAAAIAKLPRFDVPGS